jgi:hypothetical protein
MGLKELREKILTSALKRERVSVPEWECDVELWEPTAQARERYQAGLVDFGPDGKPKRVGANLALVRLTASCLRTVEGELIFQDADTFRLAETSGAVLDRLSSVALRLGGLIPAEAEAAKKNCAETGDVGSS